jgi:hypothetical protein
MLHSARIALRRQAQGKQLATIRIEVLIMSVVTLIFAIASLALKAGFTTSKVAIELADRNT